MRCFGVSLSAMTKSVLRISEQMKTKKRFKDETDQILYSIFNICDPNTLANTLI